MSERFGRFVQRNGRTWLETAPTRDGPWSLYVDATNAKCEVSVYVEPIDPADPSPARLPGDAHGP